MNSIAGTLICSGMTLAMDPKEKKPLDSELAWHGLAVVFREARDQIVMDILRNDPSITGRELTRYRGLLPVSVLRDILQELWAKRQSAN